MTDKLLRLELEAANNSAGFWKKNVLELIQAKGEIEPAKNALQQTLENERTKHAETLAELNSQLANALARADEIAKKNEADSRRLLEISSLFKTEKEERNAQVSALTSQLADSKSTLRTAKAQIQEINSKLKAQEGLKVQLADLHIRLAQAIEGKEKQLATQKATHAIQLAASRASLAEAQRKLHNTTSDRGALRESQLQEQNPAQAALEETTRVNRRPVHQTQEHRQATPSFQDNIAPITITTSATTYESEARRTSGRNKQLPKLLPSSAAAAVVEQSSGIGASLSNTINPALRYKATLSSIPEERKNILEALPPFKCDDNARPLLGQGFNFKYLTSKLGLANHTNATHPWQSLDAIRHSWAPSTPTDNGFAFSEVEDIPWNIFVKFPARRREGPSVWHYLGLYSFDLVGDTPNQSTISTLEWNTCFSESSQAAMLERAPIPQPRKLSYDLGLKSHPIRLLTCIGYDVGIHNMLLGKDSGAELDIPRRKVGKGKGKRRHSAIEGANSDTEGIDGNPLGANAESGPSKRRAIALSPSPPSSSTLSSSLNAEDMLDFECNA